MSPNKNAEQSLPQEQSTAHILEVLDGGRFESPAVQAARAEKTQLVQEANELFNALQKEFKGKKWERQNNPLYDAWVKKTTLVASAEKMIQEEEALRATETSMKNAGREHLSLVQAEGAPALDAKLAANLPESTSAGIEAKLTKESHALETKERNAVGEISALQAEQTAHIGAIDRLADTAAETKQDINWLEKVRGLIQHEKLTPDELADFISHDKNVQKELVEWDEEAFADMRRAEEALKTTGEKLLENKQALEELRAAEYKEQSSKMSSAERVWQNMKFILGRGDMTPSAKEQTLLQERAELQQERLAARTDAADAELQLKNMARVKELIYGRETGAFREVATIGMSQINRAREEKGGSLNDQMRALRVVRAKGTPAPEGLWFGPEEILAQTEARIKEKNASAISTEQPPETSPLLELSESEITGYDQIGRELIQRIFTEKTDASFIQNLQDTVQKMHKEESADLLNMITEIYQFAAEQFKSDLIKKDELTEAQINNLMKSKQRAFGTLEALLQKRASAKDVAPARAQEKQEKKLTSEKIQPQAKTAAAESTVDRAWRSVFVEQFEPIIETLYKKGDSLSLNDVSAAHSEASDAIRTNFTGFSMQEKQAIRRIWDQWVNGVITRRTDKGLKTPPALADFIDTIGQMIVEKEIKPPASAAPKRSKSNWLKRMGAALGFVAAASVGGETGRAPEAPAPVASVSPAEEAHEAQASRISAGEQQAAKKMSAPPAETPAPKAAPLKTVSTEKAATAKPAPRIEVASAAPAPFRETITPPPEAPKKKPSKGAEKLNPADVQKLRTQLSDITIKLLRGPRHDDVLKMHGAVGDFVRAVTKGGADLSRPLIEVRLDPYKGQLDDLVRDLNSILTETHPIAQNGSASETTPSITTSPDKNKEKTVNTEQISAKSSARAAELRARAAQKLMKEASNQNDAEGVKRYQKMMEIAVQSMLREADKTDDKDLQKDYRKKADALLSIER